MVRKPELGVRRHDGHMATYTGLTGYNNPMLHFGVASAARIAPGGLMRGVASGAS